MMIARHLRITGRVQGVWYRQWFGEQAQPLGLAGWVRNRADGSVEAWVQGPAADVEAIVAAAADGPPAASVADVAVTDSPVDPMLTGFARRPTL